jgi:hypothetical protein
MSPALVKPPLELTIAEPRTCCCCGSGRVFDPLRAPVDLSYPLNYLRSEIWMPGALALQAGGQVLLRTALLMLQQLAEEAGELDR